MSLGTLFNQLVDNNKRMSTLTKELIESIKKTQESLRQTLNDEPLDITESVTGQSIFNQHQELKSKPRRIETRIDSRVVKFDGRNVKVEFECAKDAVVTDSELLYILRFNKELKEEEEALKSKNKKRPLRQLLRDAKQEIAQLKAELERLRQPTPDLPECLCGGTFREQRREFNQ